MLSLYQLCPNCTKTLFFSLDWYTGTAKQAPIRLQPDRGPDHDPTCVEVRHMATANSTRRFVPSLILDLLFEIRVFTRINPSLAVRAERDLLDIAGG